MKKILTGLLLLLFTTAYAEEPLIPDFKTSTVAWLLKSLNQKEGVLSFKQLLQNGYQITYIDKFSSFKVVINYDENYENFWLETKKPDFSLFGARIGDSRENVLKKLKIGNIKNLSDDVNHLIYVIIGQELVLTFEKGRLFEIKFNPVGD